MTVTDKTLVQIPSLQFNLYELVTRHWNSQERHTKIVQRWFNPDDGSDGYWFYKVSEDEQLYPEEAIEPHD